MCASTPRRANQGPVSVPLKTQFTLLSSILGDIRKLVLRALILVKFSIVFKTVWLFVISKTSTSR